MRLTQDRFEALIGEAQAAELDPKALCVGLPRAVRGRIDWQRPDLLEHSLRVVATVDTDFTPTPLQIWLYNGYCRLQRTRQPHAAFVDVLPVFDWPPPTRAPGTQRRLWQLGLAIGALIALALGGGWVWPKDVTPRLSGTLNQSGQPVPGVGAVLDWQSALAGTPRQIAAPGVCFATDAQRAEPLALPWGRLRLGDRSLGAVGDATRTTLIVGQVQPTPACAQAVEATQAPLGVMTEVITAGPYTLAWRARPLGEEYE